MVGSNTWYDLDYYSWLCVCVMHYCNVPTYEVNQQEANKLEVAGLHCAIDSSNPFGKGIRYRVHMNICVSNFELPII